MSHRYRLYPKPPQARVCRHHCADARFVYNVALEQARRHRSEWGPTPGPAERSRQLAEARKDSWLGQGSSSVQQQAVRDFDRAMAGFFSGTHRYPTWRKAGVNEGFCVRDVTVKRLNRKWATVVVPKVGPVRFRLSRPLPQISGMARVTMDRSGRWQVSFASLQPAVLGNGEHRRIGIDRGVTTTVATSDAKMLRIPTSPKLQARIASGQRRLSRQKRGSKRRAATRARVSRLHARIADRRVDWVEKQTTRLVASSQLVVLEELNIKSMSARPKPRPDPDNPPAHLPNGAAAKSGLNRGIFRSCWGAFERRLTDKAQASGVQVVFVNPRFSSQQCRRCGHVTADNRESQAVFACRSCGHANHADTNAAQVILARGESLLAHTPGYGACRPSAGARTSPDLPAARTSGKVAA